MGQSRNASGQAFASIIGGVYLWVEVGGRFWIWNYCDADPGLSPNTTLIMNHLGMWDSRTGVFTEP